MGSVGSGYTKFKDKPSLWGRSFDGDAQDIKDFFRDNTNSYDIIEQVAQDRKAVQAFGDWAVGWFMDGQQYDGFSNMSLRDQERTRIYDKYLDQSVINKGFETRRLASAELLRGTGNKTITEEQLKALVGQDIIAKGNMSTATASQGLGISSSRHPIEYVFQFPKGSKGAGMWIGDYRINDEWGHRQREFITNRDAVYTMKDYKWNEKRGVWEVTMRYKGKVDHDYS